MNNLSIDVLFENLLQHPSIWVVMQRVQKRLEAERTARQYFYEIMEENKKMEFINGKVYLQSPVTLRHNEATGFLYSLPNVYVRKHKLGFVGIEKILISLTRNDYEPDICFFVNDKARHFTASQKQFPAPDFVVEVLSPSTEQHDRHLKMEDYAAHDIDEYWLIDPEKQTVEQYCLNNDTQVYELQIKANEGNISSRVIEGFTIPIKAVFDETANLSAMQGLV